MLLGRVRGNPNRPNPKRPSSEKTSGGITGGIRNRANIGAPKTRESDSDTSDTFEDLKTTLRTWWDKLTRPKTPPDSEGPHVETDHSIN